MFQLPLRLLAAVAGGAFVVGGNVAAFYHFKDTHEEQIPGVQKFQGLSRRHTTHPVVYPQVPPVGGAHNPVLLNCGIYPSPVPVEHAVHSLEHGTVWITYRPDLPVDQVAGLRDLVRGKSYTLLSPYPRLPWPVVASAWGRQLRLGSASDPRLPRFLRVYRVGPQTPERGAPCSGGVGRPLKLPGRNSG
jgi:hypothetical protein